MNQENPFLSKDFYVDWKRLVPEKIVPDITLALSNAQKNLEEIEKLLLVPEKISYANAVEAFSEATRELGNAWNRVCHLESVSNTPEFRAAYNEVLPKVSAFFSGIFLNSKIREVIKTASEKAAGTMSEIQKRFVSEILADFHENGADLPEEKKSRLEEINTQLSALTTKFAENVLDSTNSWEKFIEDEALLAGVPETAKKAAKADAERKNRPAAWRFTLQAPSLFPILQYAENDELRKEFWAASNAVGNGGKFDNTSLVHEILSLRNEKALLLGFKNFADYATSRRMAKSGANAREFIENVRARIEKFFKKENEELENFARERHEISSEKFGKIAPWARAFVAEKLRKEKFDFDEELLRPYFQLENVVAGAFEIASKLYKIEIREKTGVPVWDENVKVYEIFDGEKFLGAFYADWFPRESKRSGAWMNPLETRTKNTPGNLGLICGNLAPAVAGTPSLLNFDEVVTIFHEFGHLLHHVLSEVEIPEIAGTNVAWDFVELPSQIMENWCRKPESLSLFAKHFSTGTPLPSELLQKLLRAQKFRSATAAMRQLSFAKMDLDFHIDAKTLIGCDLDKYWNETLAEYQIPSPFPTTSMARKFLHLFSESTGYAAGYYSYKWAEMLEADCFTRFENEGILNEKTGREFREKILAKGNSEPAEKLFRDFMKRDPEIAPMLIRDGLC